MGVENLVEETNSKAAMVGTVSDVAVYIDPGALTDEMLGSVLVMMEVAEVGGWQPVHGCRQTGRVFAKG